MRPQRAVCRQRLGLEHVERRRAKRIAKHLGMPYLQVPGGEPDLDAFRGRVRASLWQSDGLMSLKYLMGMYASGW